jgi:hypothetical protein
MRVKGHLDLRWAEWFDGMTITQEAAGTTTLSGPLADQAALHGLLVKVHDLSLTLLSVNAVETETEYG